jgi:hypothetical protein
MRASRWSRSVWFAGLLSLAGCAMSTSQQVEFDAALRVKPDAAMLKGEPLPAKDRLPLQLALVMPANLPGGLTRLPYTPGAWALRKRDSGLAWQLETGLIVEEALMHTLGGALGGELTAMPAAPAPAAGYGVVLEMAAVHLDYDEHLRVLVPLPVPLMGTMVGEFEVRTRLILNLSLLDAQGSQVWLRSYDDGLRTGVWVVPGGYPLRNGDPDWRTGVNQMAHDAAGRLAQRVLQDLREWHEGQQRKPRSL